MAQVVIIHGWSDTSESFEPLAGFLEEQGIAASQIHLGDYISLDDDVRVEDVAKRLESVLDSRLGTGELQEPFDMIVHSTGGLVARQWLSEYYPAGGSPIRRLIMLAPANHGSPLAAKGKSLLGRVAKGWNNWFETGTEMLNSLELASPYQWSLVQRDLLARSDDADSPYGKTCNRVLPFVIIGTHPYASGARKLVDENGGDGTVRVPGANMNTRGLTIEFSGESGKPEITHWHRRHDFDLIPFAVLPDRNHTTVTDPTEAGAASATVDQDRLGALIVAALETDAGGYDGLANDWKQRCEETASLAENDADTVKKRIDWFGDDRPAEYFHQYVQVVMHVIDDHGNEVGDYFVEFSDGSDGEDRESSEFFHTEVLESVKLNSTNRAFRCFLIDRTDLVTGYYSKITEPHLQQVLMTISAAPPGANVTYFGGATHGAQGSVLVHHKKDERWLRRNQTHYVEVVIPRTPRDEVFRLRSVNVPFTSV